MQEGAPASAILLARVPREGYLPPQFRILSDRARPRCGDAAGLLLEIRRPVPHRRQPLMVDETIALGAASRPPPIVSRRHH